jgi:hypothetical protein
MQVFFKIVCVLVIGGVAAVLAVLSPLLLLIYCVFYTINLKRQPAVIEQKSSNGFGFSEILNTMQKFK